MEWWSDGMSITVHFYSYFKDITGCSQSQEELPGGATISDLLAKVFDRFPQLAPMQKAMLVAVGVEYQNRNYELKDGDEVSLFPPVQGG